MQPILTIIRNSAVRATSIFLGISLFLSACVPDFLVSNPDWVVIEAGDHEALPKRNVGVLFSPTEDITHGTPPHQIDGARVGWRWNPQRGRIDLGAYGYVDKNRIDFKVGETALNTPTKLIIKIDYNRKLYQILGGKPIPFTHNKTFGYKTGLYFGGSQPAPHQIKVKIVED